MGVWIHTSHVIINVAIPIKILNTETLIKQFCFWEFSLHMWLSICKMLYAIFIYFYINLLYLFGEGNGNPLQCSCLENPRDGEAWWSAVYGVAESRTRLKQLSIVVLLRIFLMTSKMITFNRFIGSFDILFCKDPIHLSTYILGYPLIAVIYK